MIVKILLQFSFWSVRERVFFPTWIAIMSAPYATLVPVHSLNRVVVNVRNFLTAACQDNQKQMFFLAKWTGIEGEGLSEDCITFVGQISSHKFAH